ncbi:hypothetical protein SteCoe_11633 [Stentor coeruleus]|uniref:Uncharacterized protein n=1 Tax=Stentor coeruleus TaxID=5963 RepID=A0A1R2CCP7_9CILI|nr:hypothetical protein SteCoe_11633 [Stentor coeruleus]
MVNHNYKQITKFISPSDRSEIFQTLKNALERLQESERLLLNCQMNALQEIYSIGSKAHKVFKLLKNLCAKMIEEAANFNQITLVNQTEGIQTTMISSVNVLEELIFYAKELPKSNLKFSFLGLSPFRQNETTNSTLIRKPQQSEPCLYYFKENTKTLVKFDCNTKAFNEVNIKKPKREGCSKSICILSGGDRVFCSGGYNNITKTLCDMTFIVYVKTRSIEVLPSTSTRTNAAGIFHSNSIYIFGGHADTILNTAEAINLKSKKWRSLANLPGYFRNTSLATIGTKIIISCNPNTILEFDILKNSYVILANFIPINQSNILLQDGLRISLLTDTLWISDKEDRRLWNVYQKTYNFGFTTCNPVVHGRYAYFYDWKGKVYQVSLENYDISEIS